MLNTAKVFKKSLNRELVVLCFVEMCERFSHYAMRGMLVLYMCDQLVFTANKSYGVFASFSALVYLAPLLGGYASDCWLGIKNSIVLGGIFLTLGYVMLALPGNDYFYYGLATVTIGSGFFIPNISSAVGQLYPFDSPRRESAFSFFYAAINFGALIPPLILTLMIVKFGWKSGFLLSAISIFIATIIFHLYSLGNHQHNSKSGIKGLTLALILIPIIVTLIKSEYLANTVVFGVGVGFFIYAFKKTFSFSHPIRKRLHICFAITLFSIIFEILYQQTLMSMTMFVNTNVDKQLGNWEMPTLMFQALNPIFIICCAPAISKMWLWLENKRINPPVAMKFGLGTVIMGISFCMLIFPIYQSMNGKIGLEWIIASCLLQSIAELLVSTVGLSMISELSPRSMVASMMGIWYFASAAASSLAGIFSQLTVVNSPQFTLSVANGYANTFGILGMISIIAGLAIFVLLPYFNYHKNEIMDLESSSLDMRSS